jgi:hypothetical protein
MRPDSSVLQNKVLRAAAVLALLAPFAGCTAQQRQGTGSSYLIINSLECASGAKPDDKANTCSSDVITYVKQQVNGKDTLVPTIYEDAGLVSFKLGMKDPTLTPSPTNSITINRYHVQYVRADGRNTPGVDVPYPFDGGMTVTVSDEDATGAFAIVRLQAKEEAPLKPLAGGGGAIAISTLAEVTFYGRDQAGHDVSVMGRVGINFADWGDPQ